MRNILLLILAVFIFVSFAKNKDKKNIQPPIKPIETTWSKIKEMFE